jgi:hypothetical protein
MKGRNLCEAHEKELSERSASFNLTRSDALDQLWSIYEAEFSGNDGGALMGFTPKGQNEMDFLEQVAAELRSLGREAETEHMGGGIICIFVPIKDGVSSYFGLANETWGADIYIEGEYLDGQYLETGFKIEEQPNVSALTIHQALQKFEADGLEKVKALGAPFTKAFVKECAEAGLNAFWLAVAEKNSQIRSGDFPPELDHRFKEVAEEMVAHWLRING